MIAKPGKMRWDYREKRKDAVVVKKSFISNGQTLYDVEHDNKQVIKKNLSQDLMPVAVSFLYGKGDLDGRVQRRARHERQVGAARRSSSS